VVPSQPLPRTFSPSWPLPARQPSLGPTDVHVWRAVLEQPPPAVIDFRQLLSADERARADHFHFERDRRHFTVARGVLRNLLGRYLGINAADLRFAYTEYGKPYLEPAPPNQTRALKFNLAHAGDLAVYAITTIGDIGVDLERLNPDFAGAEIAQRFFSPTEIASLEQLPAPVRRLAFFNCWTRKEAFIKAKGLGLSLALDQFDVTLAPAEKAMLLRTRWDQDEAERWSLRALELGPDYVGAVALEGHHWQLSCWEFVA